MKTHLRPKSPLQWIIKQIGITMPKHVKTKHKTLIFANMA
jgi:hypothetical protein